MLERVLDLVAVRDHRGRRAAGRREPRAGARGAATAARGGRPGLDALLAIAHVDRARAGAGEIAFRVAPRINACGRLGHPAEALELLLTDDARRARALAERLDDLNRERQAVEDRILRDALRRHEELEPERRDARGLVLWSDEWHAGVVGIVASRLVERLRRPVVLVAVEGEEGRGSGRSLPVYDLHAALAATSERLEAYGGHRVAAGVTVRADRLEDFARAFAAHADAALADEALSPVERIDAVASLADVSLDVADELGRLEPFGLGNPGVSVLLPAVEIGDVRPMGADNKHLRFVVRSSAGTCRVVQWGGGRDAETLGGGRFDVVARVERNDWNGTSSVQLVGRGAVPVADLVSVPAGLCTTPCDASCAALARPSALDDAGVQLCRARRCAPPSAGGGGRAVGGRAHRGHRRGRPGGGRRRRAPPRPRPPRAAPGALRPAGCAAVRRVRGRGARCASGHGRRRRVARAGRPRHARRRPSSAPPSATWRCWTRRRRQPGSRRSTACRRASTSARWPDRRRRPWRAACTRPAPRGRSRRRSGGRSRTAAARPTRSTSGCWRPRARRTRGSARGPWRCWSRPAWLRATARATERSTTAPGRVDLTAIPAFAAAADVHADGLRVLGGEPLPVAV